VDERLFPANVKLVEEKFGAAPKTEYDFRKVLSDKDIDVISIATPDHWHALMTIMACQAGKDVYVEKPVCFNIFEGRKMVEAARKYNRIVQAGICYRDSKAVKEGIRFIHDGKLGKVYMAKGVTYRYRESIGRVADSPIPEGLNWTFFWVRRPIAHTMKTGFFTTGISSGIPAPQPNSETTESTGWIPRAGHSTRMSILFR
jgi:predicted dehydrogenase